MGRILSAIFGWLAWKGAILVLILAALIGWGLFGGELKRASDLAHERAALAAQLEVLSRQVAEMKRDVDDRTRRAASAARSIESMLEQKRAERDELEARHPLARYVPLSEAWQRIRLLNIEIGIHQAVVEKEAQARELSARGVKALLSQRESEMSRASGRVAAIDAEIEKSFVARATAIVRQKLPLALAILAGIILLPTGIKLFLYFVVAPLASRRPPIRLLPSASGSVRALPAEGSRVSAVSLPVVLEEDQELLVQAAYLQSTALQARKSTKWLLNASIPVSSLLSGMYLLTRVGPSGREAAVISATKDPHGEVGIIELGEGAAFVCQPRCLAGAIQDPRRPIRITRHWRLGSLQAWLTLQLRFLVFHGPGRLVLKGGRGIRVESPGTGRLINQSATLGFSANLAYANTRCETFVAYWLGKEDLFNDLFAGESGVYAYEEVPDPNRSGGMAGRGLEGFFDAILKIFGV